MSDDIIHAEGVRFAFSSSARRSVSCSVSGTRSAPNTKPITSPCPDGELRPDLPKSPLARWQTVSVYKWCWVTFGEQSRVIYRECRSGKSPIWRLLTHVTSVDRRFHGIHGPSSGPA